MRKSLFYLALLMVACSGNESAAPGTEQPPAPHVPVITNVALSPDSVNHMHGDGTVAVTAEIAFRDTGLDVQTLWVRMPDGTTIEFDELSNTETGTFTENFVMSTEAVGIFTVEFWLVDKAGGASNHRTADISVGWINRLGGLPYVLNDVMWDGTLFIAVGNDGAVLTSADGIDWVARDSATNANLYELAAFEANIFAVGDEIILLSTDHGENWITKAVLDGVTLTAVAINTTQVVVGGNGPDLLQPTIMISEDRGDTWQAVDSPSDICFSFRDLSYADKLFVAATDCGFSLSGARVHVSADGKSWHEIIVRQEGRGLQAIVHDGSQFVAVGGFGAVFTSFDGFNWTDLGTSVADVDHRSAAWSGSKLVLAGGVSWLCNLAACNPGSESPVGMASTDGGASWDVFNIDGRYQSNGLAFGNGRFVSVGQSSGEGAVYTAD